MNTLLHFTAEWCAPCKKSQPIVDAFVTNNNIDYKKIDVDEQLEMTKKYDIMMVPTFISVNGENIIARHHGVPSDEILKNLTGI